MAAAGMIRVARRVLARSNACLRFRRACLGIAVVLAGVAIPVRAQTLGFLPETDFYVKINSSMRTDLEAKDDRDAGVSTQFSIGPSIQFSLKPLLRLKNVKAFDLDDAKQRPLVVELGYRTLTAPDKPITNRMETIVTTNFPLKFAFHLSDRNRADLDWQNGAFSWRYRNKVTLDRTFAIHSYHLIPYAAGEFYYTSQYSKWSTTALFAGCLFPVGKHVQFDTYYEHENNTGKKENKQDQYMGLAAHFFFSIR
ncbi:MAG TPA: DUF2490 domain-containing protein [Candidatus Acidoferrales bacterium]|nr:DUF2490 domain-containing protein [Candidatus Acidoferrales bacterium]